jgi:hypothetical protein
MSRPLWTWEQMPMMFRLLVGTPEEREAEAKRQGIFETWETKARRDHEDRKSEGRSYGSSHKRD